MLASLLKIASIKEMQSSDKIFISSAVISQRTCYIFQGLLIIDNIVLNPKPSKAVCMMYNTPGKYYRISILRRSSHTFLFFIQWVICDM